LHLKQIFGILIKSLKDIIGFNKRKRVITPDSVESGEESPDTSPAHAGQAYGLTTRRGIHNARGANRDAECRKARGVLLDSAQASI